jgi:hypothetical protein
MSTRSKLTDSGVERLSNAVVVMAVTDYKTALKSSSDTAKRMRYDCERFFKSETFDFYTVHMPNLRGEVLMNSIQRQVELEKQSKISKNKKLKSYIDP